MFCHRYVSTRCLCQMFLLAWAKAMHSISRPLTHFAAAAAPPQLSPSVQKQLAQIREVLPDYSDGFLMVCLQHFKGNTEQVLHALLEGSLQKELQKLDPQMPLQPCGHSDSRRTGKGGAGGSTVGRGCISVLLHVWLHGRGVSARQPEDKQGPAWRGSGACVTATGRPATDCLMGCSLMATSFCLRLRIFKGLWRSNVFSSPG